MPTLVATGQYTIADTNDGLYAALTADSVVVPADNSGTVSSFATANTTFKVYVGGIDSSSSWAFYISATGGGISYRDSDDSVDRTGTGPVNGIISGTTGYVSVTVLSQDVSYLDITATRSGYDDITRRFSIAKAKTGNTGAGTPGAAGPAGVRGSVSVAVTTTGSTWSNTEAAAAISSYTSGDIPRAGDVVTLYNSSASYSETRIYSSGGTWTVLTAYLGGNLIVDGAIGTSKLAAGSVTAGKIAANAIVAGDGVIQNAAITNALIADLAVDTAKIADAAINNAKIFSVDASKINTGYLTADRVAANSLTADKIASGQLSAGVSIYVGGSTSSAPLVLLADGQVISNDTVSGNKARLWSGDVEIYKNVPAIGSVLYKALNRVEVGTATNNTLTTIPGYFTSQPKVIVSPQNLQLYNSTYSGQSQTVTCSANNIVETSSGSMVWQFTPVANLNLAAATGTTTVAASSGTVSTAWTSATYTTPANTNAVTANITAGSNRGNGSSQYFYRTVSARLEYFNGTSWVAGTTVSANLGASTTATATLTPTISMASGSAWQIRAVCSASDTNGTVFGTIAYTQQTVSSTAGSASTGSLGAAVGSSTSTNNITKNVQLTGVSLTPPGGSWTLVNYYYTFSWSMTGSYSGSDFITVSYGYTSGGTTFYQLNGVAASATYLPSSSGTFTSGNFTQTPLPTTFWVNVNENATFNGTTSNQITISQYSVTNFKLNAVYQQPTPNSTTAADSYTFNSYTQTLATSTILATGTLNWMAIGS